MPSRPPVSRAAAPAPSRNETGGLFDRLPDHAKEQFRQDEMLREMRRREIEQRRFKTRNRYLLEGVVLFVPCSGVLGHPLLAILAAIYGGLVGLAWWRAGGGHYTMLTIAVIAYFAWSVFFGWSLFMFFLFAGLSGALGAAHTLRKSDGAEC